ncbi:MAG: hypothetical protein HOV66_14340 [Streptomycetaceae bacterium]|nr:hypothetical protein [Streptomycetaceae bacterium]
MATALTVRPPELLAALGYEEPFLLEKLVKDRIVAGEAAAELLFTEVKRYLVLTQVDRHEVSWEMYSRRVDEVWHQFVLYTREYAAFCERFFGGFVHHRPSNAPAMAARRSVRPSTLASFRARYQELYGEPLPGCWTDATGITPGQRVISDDAGRLVVSESGDRASLVRHDGAVAFSVDAIALAALEFVADTPVFYVRELPGDLTDDERCALAETLLGQRLLRIAP